MAQHPSFDLYQNEKLGTLTLSFSKMNTQRFTPVRWHEGRKIRRKEEEYLVNQEKV
jgi:hypothetical protein